MYIGVYNYVSVSHRGDQNISEDFLVHNCS